MASLYPKKVSGKTYWYLREMARIDGKPKMVSERYLDTAADIEAAMAGAVAVPQHTRHLAFGSVASGWSIGRVRSVADHHPRRARLRHPGRRPIDRTGLGDRIPGPGKQADLLVVEAEAVNNMPLNDAVGTLVLGADPRNISTVLVAGRTLKRDGLLLGVDINELRREVTDSRDAIHRTVDS